MELRIIVPDGPITAMSLQAVIEDFLSSTAHALKLWISNFHQYWKDLYKYTTKPITLGGEIKEAKAPGGE